jgi:hypothetical protein
MEAVGSSETLVTLYRIHDEQKMEVGNTDQSTRCHIPRRDLTIHHSDNLVLLQVTGFRSFRNNHGDEAPLKPLLLSWNLGNLSPH